MMTPPKRWRSNCLHTIFMNTICEGCIPPGKAAIHHAPCRWLISLDFDGTLRADEGPAIPPLFFELMEEWRPLGIRWGINTGRTLPYLFSELQTCSPVLPDFICTCERYIYLANAEGKLCPAIDHNRKCEHINMQLRLAFCSTLHACLARIRSEHPELHWELATADPLSVEAADSATMDALMPMLTPLTTPQITIQRAGRYLRFADSRFSKGTALAYVCRELQVEASHLFIMGDGHNDLHAFMDFPEAFCAAPADAHPEVAAWLTQKGGHVSEDTGVISALKVWFNSCVLPALS